MMEERCLDFEVLAYIHGVQAVGHTTLLWYCSLIGLPLFGCVVMTCFRKILNVPAALPLYFTATALAKLAHQERCYVERFRNVSMSGKEQIQDPANPSFKPPSKWSIFVWKPEG